MFKQNSIEIRLKYNFNSSSSVKLSIYVSDQHLKI